MGIITALLKSLKILVDFLVVTTVSLNRWQYHMWSSDGRDWCSFKTV